MQNLYTEEQYNQYLQLMDKSANCEYIIEGARIYLQIKDWLTDNNITEEMKDQMDNRMEKECDEEYLV